MSLRHASRLLLRAMRAKLQPAAASVASKPAVPTTAGAVKPPPASGGAPHRPQARRFSGGLLTESSTEKAKKMIRRAEKSENVMHLVCWGPN